MHIRLNTRIHYSLYEFSKMFSKNLNTKGEQKNGSKKKSYKEKSRKANYEA